MDKDIPPPKGETHDTGYWIGNKNRGYFWKRTAPIEEYDKIGIPKKYPVDEHGNAYLNADNLPEHLKERHASAGYIDRNPNYYQEAYEALRGTLEPKEVVRLFTTYNLYNEVVLKHLDDDQAFKYIVGTQEHFATHVTARAREYAKRIFAQKPESKLGYETGMYLGKYQEVLKYHPNDSVALFRFGSRLSDEQPEEAIKYLIRADKYEDQARWHEKLAQTYQKLNDGSNALYHLKEFYRLDPINLTSPLCMMCLHWKRVKNGIRAGRLPLVRICWM